MAKWTYYIESTNTMTGPEELYEYETLEDAMKYCRKCIQDEYECMTKLGEECTNPDDMPTIQHNGERKWDVDASVFYALPPEATDRVLVLLSTLDGQTDYVIRTDKVKEFWGETDYEDDCDKE